MRERLERSDYRFIAVCVVLAGAATWYSARNFDKAFPEASIDFRITRQQGRALAQRFLASRHFDLARCRDAARFDYDDNAKTFLERTVGLQRANQLMGARVRLWRWSYRWFRPQQKEEFQASVSPSGELIGFNHDLPEDAARPTLSVAGARALAENFLRSNAHRDPAALDFVEVNETARPHRMDREFVWKERDFHLQDATYRVWVTILGDEVGGFGEYLKAPEQWQRDYQALRSQNAMAQNIDQAFMVLLLVGMLVAIVKRTRRQDVRWRLAAMIGLAGALLSLCAGLNAFPLAEFSFRTTDSYTSFVIREIMNVATGALAVGGFLFLIAAAAEPLYREAYGSRISVGNLFQPRGLRTRSFFKGAILGVSLAAIFIAYQTAFYLAAYRLGGWSPADVPYSDELNTAFPWLFVLFGGYFPAVFEEFTFRMFAIPFLHKLLRWLPLAVVLAGFLWGFGHSSYPQQPFFIRGVEVGIGGVALGLIMLRWGILPTLVWHYSVDAIYGAMLMLRSHSLYFKLSGAASAGLVILPITIALAAYWVRGGFEPADGLLNRDEPGPMEPAPVPLPELQGEAPEFRGLGSRLRLAAVAVFALGLATLLIPVTRFGESPRYQLDAGQALRFADAFVRAQGLDPATFHHVSSTAVHWGGNDSLSAKYFLERLPLGRASQLFEQERPLRYWTIRYFRPLDQEEIEIAVHPETGRILGFDRTLPEDRAGADLSDEAARQAALAFAASRGMELASMELKENSAEKKKARLDHTLVWEARPGDARNVDAARYRTEIAVDGDRVTAWRSYWRIPEAFARSRERQNWVSIAVAGWRTALMVLLAVWGLWRLLHHIRHGLVPWRGVLRVAAPIAILAAGGALLELPQIYERYDTAVPLANFLVSTCITEAVMLVVAFLGFALATAFLTSTFPDCLHAFAAVRRRQTAVDAVAAACAAVGFCLAASQLAAVLDNRFHAQALLAIGTPDVIESLFPALSALAGAAQRTLNLGAIVALAALLYQRLPRIGRIPAAALAGLALVAASARTVAEVAVSYAPVLFAVIAILIFCQWFGRRNYLSYALVLWLAALYGPLADLLGNPNPYYHAQGWMVLAAGIASIVWLVMPAARRLTAAANQQPFE